MNQKEIKKIRNKLEMTQSEFAEKLEVSLRTVQKWKHGETKIRIGNVKAIKFLEREFQLKYESELQTAKEKPSEGERLKKLFKQADKLGYSNQTISEETGISEEILFQYKENPPNILHKGVVNSLERFLFSTPSYAENISLKEMTLEQQVEILKYLLNNSEKRIKELEINYLGELNKKLDQIKLDIQRDYSVLEDFVYDSISVIGKKMEKQLFREKLSELKEKKFGTLRNDGTK